MLLFVPGLLSVFPGSNQGEDLSVRFTNIMRFGMQRFRACLNLLIADFEQPDFLTIFFDRKQLSRNQNLLAYESFYIPFRLLLFAGCSYLLPACSSTNTRI